MGADVRASLLMLRKVGMADRRGLRGTILSRGDGIRGAERGDECPEVVLSLGGVHLCCFLEVSQSSASSHLIPLCCSE